MACAATSNGSTDFRDRSPPIQSPSSAAPTESLLSVSSVIGINNNISQNSNNNKRRPSRASDRILATAAAMLKVLGISNSSTRRNKNRQTDTKATIKMLKSNDKNSTTMPAMPKEKSSTVAENNYSELKLKEHFAVEKIDMCSTDQTSTAHITASSITSATSAASTTSSLSTTPPTTPTQLSTTTSTSTSTSSRSMNRSCDQPTSASGGSSSNSNLPTKRSANDFRFGKSVGEGSFSTVYLAKDIHTNKEYAIKVCEKTLILREKKQDYIKREREVMNKLSNVPGFVNLYCTFQDYKSLYFVMTYAKNGDLLPYIQKVGSFDHKSTQFYAAELVLALENMHQRGIIHRDLKPENILFDEKMHTLIADFGSAKILTPAEQAMEPNDSDNFDKNRKRTNSFVGTAQYVSPEILTGQRATRAADLWALGCIIYQMISGLPPFRAGTEYLIFQKILKLDLTFPDGFEKTAKDLVERLLQIDPSQRLGADNTGDLYDSIRDHPFFDGVDWDNLRSQTPPSIHPYLPGIFDEEDDDLLNQYKVPDHLEPGLDDRQLTRLLGIELGTSVSSSITKEPKNILNIPDYERQQRIDAQKADKWHQFVDGEVILKQGFVNKRKGLFARKRMLLLTTGPRMVYVDPVQMVKKGEIPWSSELRVEPKNFKIFFIHTPNRTYYLEDPQGYALEWCQTIEDVRRKTYET